MSTLVWPVVAQLSRSPMRMSEQASRGVGAPSGETPATTAGRHPTRPDSVKGNARHGMQLPAMKADRKCAASKQQAADARW